MRLTPDHAGVLTARQQVLLSALRVIESELGANEGNSHEDDERDYADDELAKAARQLATAVEGLPADNQPVGWRQRAEQTAGEESQSALDKLAVEAATRAVAGMYAQVYICGGMGRIEFTDEGFGAWYAEERAAIRQGERAELDAKDARIAELEAELKDASGAYWREREQHEADRLAKDTEIGRLRRDLAEANRRYEERSPTQWAYSSLYAAAFSSAIATDVAEAGVKRLTDLNAQYADRAIENGQRAEKAEAQLADTRRLLNNRVQDCVDLTQRAEQAEAERDQLRAVVEQFDGLLSSIALYIKWRYVTKQLTTKQKDLFADAIERHHSRVHGPDGEDPDPEMAGLPGYASRWWRDASAGEATR